MGNTTSQLKMRTLRTSSFLSGMCKNSCLLLSRQITQQCVGMGRDTQECTSVVVLLVTVGLADASCAGGWLDINWDVVLPILIAVIALSCIICYWCVRYFGFPSACRGADTVPRSEYIALQKRLEKLEQQVNTRQKIEEEV